MPYLQVGARTHRQSEYHNSDSPATPVLRLKYQHSNLIQLYNFISTSEPALNHTFKMINLNLFMALSLSGLNILASAQAPIQPDTNMLDGYQPGLATVCNVHLIMRPCTVIESLLIPCSAPTARLPARRPAKHLHDQLPPSR